jgi:hypothetical protein
MPQVLEQYDYFRKHLDPRYVERYGYLDGFAFAMGPVETAALVVGYENFLVGLVDTPEEIHQLLDHMTRFTLRWLKTQEQVNGKLRDRITVPVDADEETVFRAAEAAEKVRPQIQGKTIVKRVYVPKKMVSLVVK